MVSRVRLPAWIVAVSPEEATCQGLQLTYGVTRIRMPEYASDWNEFARRWVQSAALPETLVVLTEGLFRNSSQGHPCMEIIDLRRGGVSIVTAANEQQ